METLQKVADDLKSQIQDLEDRLERADGHGIGLFHLAKKLQEKRSELKVLERMLKTEAVSF